MRRIAFGYSRILSLGSSDAVIYGHGHPETEQLEKYRSPNSWVGRTRTDEYDSEPSDAQVEAALDAWYTTRGTSTRMRAALRAALSLREGAAR